MDDDELQDGQLDADGDQGDSGSGSDDSAPPADSPAPKDESKRIKDLMSKWQAAEARANRLQAQLAGAGAGQGDQGGEPQGGDDAAGDASEFVEFARENTRTMLFASDPRLADYGLTAEDIAGTTLAEMRASMTKHLKLIGGIEGKARNKILAEAGLDPDVATGASTEQAPSFSTMSDADFAKFLEQRDNRRY